jgi:diacylglycerol kinase family enzyme
VVASQRRSTRLAAWLALAGAAVLALSIVALIVRSVLAVVAALLSLALAAFAAWCAAARRGLARVVWAACAVLAVAGGTVALLVGGAGDELVVVAVSLALLTFAMRKAFDEAPRSDLRTTRRERKLLLVNPRSGDGKAAQAGLEREAVRRGIEPVVLGPGGDLRALAEELVLRADVIGMAGGDGSQAVVADVASAHDVAFVCVPVGTRNHFALDLGLDVTDVVAALDAFDSVGCVEHAIDLAHVNGRTFVNNVSLGIYAEIVKDRAYRAAKLATAARLLPDLLGEHGATGISFTGPDGELHEGTRLLLVSNNPYVLARLVGFGGRPRLDTGTLGIVAVDVAGAADAAALVSLEAVGAVTRFEGWHQWTADGLTVHAAGPVAAGVDGEAVLLEPPLVFATEPRALRARLSADADRRRARRAQERGGATQVLENLWAIAAG